MAQGRAILGMAERVLLTVVGFGAEQIDTAVDTTTVGGLTISTSAGIAMGGFRLKDIPDVPTLGTDAVNANYVRSLTRGFKTPVRLATAAALAANTPAGSGIGKTLTADANGALSVDGVATAVGNRILVKNEASGVHNGIYVVTDAGSAGTPWILTRATDFDENAEVSDGSLVMVGEGTQEGTAWYVSTNAPITVDTTALTFTEFPAITAYTWGAGLLDTSNTISVELDTTADAQGTGTGGGSSGLEFDASGDGGQLRAKVDPAGGIQRGASGLLLEIDDTPNTLDVDADGLKVVGLPLQFLVNDVTTNTSVTAANLNTLTGGATSSADSLHRHATVENAINVAAAVNAGDPVYYSANNVVTKANAAPRNGTGTQVFGVARTAQASVGQPTQVVRVGLCPGVLSGATAGAPYYLASGGGLTATAPTGNVDRVLIGYAINATDLDVRIQHLAGIQP